MRGLVIGDARLDAIVFDVGGTLVVEAAPGTPAGDLAPTLRPGVADDLARLARSFRLGVATNTAIMHEAEVRALLERAGIVGYLSAVVTSADVGAAKPDPAALLMATERLGVEPSRALCMGDRWTDREAASAAGMFFAFVGGDGLLGAVRRLTEAGV